MTEKIRNAIVAGVPPKTSPEEGEKPGFWAKYKNYVLIGAGVGGGLTIFNILSGDGSTDDLPAPGSLPR